MKLLLSILTVFLLLQVFISNNSYRERKKIFIPPPVNIKSFVFGYEQLVASLMWVRVLQDIDVCNQESVRTPYPAVREDMDTLEDILTRDLPQSRCQNGWVFQMLDVISDLDPLFLAPYIAGGTFLSVLVDDRLGAQKMFAKGIKQFPNHWNLLYRAGYHELFEMQAPEKAAVYLMRSAENGAPSWVYSLSANLYSRVGQAVLAKSILENVLQRNPVGLQSERLKRRLEKLKQIIKSNAQ